MKKKPQPEWLIDTQCVGKHRFATQAFAVKVAKQASRRKESRASAYRCVFCKGWHIGNGRMMNNVRKEK